MRTLTLIVAILAMQASGAFAQDSAFLSIPSSGFTTQSGIGGNGYDGNESGTARFFAKNFRMFAPVNLPHGVTVKALRCGGKSSEREVAVGFTLRRNEPQIANVDMATVITTVGDMAFQHPATTSITSPVVNNSRFNYYIIAETRNTDVGFCPKCIVGYCRIHYSGG